MNGDCASWVVDTFWRAGVVAVLAVLFVPRAVGAPKPPVRFSTSKVSVQVSILQPRSRQALRDKSGVAVWLVPIDELPKANGRRPERHYEIRQHNKMFEPHLLVIPTGSVVEFPNLDPWFHSVFSTSEGKGFNLGLSRGGVTGYVKFERAGPSYIFCQIHPEMAAVVLAVESSYFGISDKAGHVSIDDVPPGEYSLHVWYEAAPRRTLKAAQSVVLVVEERCELPAISVAVIKQDSPQREEQPRQP